MAITYAAANKSSLLNPAELSERLSEVIRSAMPWLVTLSNADAAQPEREGKWSAKEVIGHLTDSAVNNLARIVRLQIGPEDLPTYAQNDWVDLQHYQDREWSEVLALWFALNEHLVWTIRHIPSHSLFHKGSIAGSPLTLGFLIEDYIAHMQHHLHHLHSRVHPGEVPSELNSDESN